MPLGVLLSLKLVPQGRKVDHKQLPAGLAARQCKLPAFIRTHKAGHEDHRPAIGLAGAEAGNLLLRGQLVADLEIAAGQGGLFIPGVPLNRPWDINVNCDNGDTGFWGGYYY